MLSDDSLIDFYCRIADTGFFCMIGGSIGTIAYGEPRATLDIDLIVDLPPEGAQVLIKEFPSERFYIPDADIIRRESGRCGGHFNIIDTTTGLKADVYSFRGDELQDYGRKHAQFVNLSGIEVLLAPPTYLISMKLRYYAMSKQDKHLRDIRGMVMLSNDLIDHTVVAQWARKAEVEDAWRDCLARPGEE